MNNPTPDPINGHAHEAGPAQMTQQALKALESYAEQSIVNLVDVAAMMPRGNEYLALMAVAKVLAKVSAVWFNQDAFDAAIADARSQFGEVAVMTPEDIQQWKDAVLRLMAEQRFKRDARGKPKIILAS